MIDHELDAVEPAGLQRPEERGPERLRFGVSHLESEDFPAPIGGDPDRDDYGLGDDPPADPRFAVGRVKEHIRVGGVRQGSVAERGHVLVKVRADPRHLRLRDAGVRAERFHQIIDLPGADAVNIGLHDDREQRLIDPAAPFEQRREERPRPELRDPQLQIPRRGRKGPGTRPVALRRAGRGAFERSGADERGRFRINQLLIERLRRDTDPVGDIGEFQFPEKLEEGRLVESHRAYVFL